METSRVKFSLSKKLRKLWRPLVTTRQIYRSLHSKSYDYKYKYQVLLFNILQKKLLEVQYF